MPLPFRIKPALFLGGLAAVLCVAPARAQTYTANPPLSVLSPERVDDPLLSQLLGYGEIEVLDDLPSYEEAGDQPLSVRLVSMPGDNDACVPETDVSVCNYRYYLVVISDIPTPRTAVFDLGQLGEIADVTWLSAPDEEHVSLRLEAHRYPADVMEDNPALQAEQEIRQYTITAGLDGLRVQQERS